MRRPLIAAAVLGVSLVVAGCGGDDSSEDAGDSTTADGATTTESTSGTREEFIEMADAICAANDGAQDALRTELDSAGSPEEAADIYDRLADLSEDTISQITSLPRPEGDEAAIEDLAAVQTEAAVLVRGLAEAVRANDQARGEDLIAQLGQNAAEGDAGDEAFGLQVC